MDFFVIADGLTLLAFALAGVPGAAAVDGAEALELLDQARQKPEVGLILITERLADRIRGQVDAARWEGGRPLVLEIPDLAGPLAREESLLERLRALMGLPK
jgi:V/A-type H+-transporting ATPase subunit F